MHERFALVHPMLLFSNRRIDFRFVRKLAKRLVLGLKTIEYRLSYVIYPNRMLRFLLQPLHGRAQKAKYLKTRLAPRSSVGHESLSSRFAQRLNRVFQQEKLRRAPQQRDVRYRLVASEGFASSRQTGAYHIRWDARKKKADVERARERPPDPIASAPPSAAQACFGMRHIARRELGCGVSGIGRQSPCQCAAGRWAAR